MARMGSADFVVKTGDLATFNPTFGAAIVIVAPGNLTGSGRFKIDGQLVCVQGDEATDSVPGIGLLSRKFNVHPHLTPKERTYLLESIAHPQPSRR
jgi:hypothetical protein